MRALIIADGRSPTTRRWIQTVLEIGHEVVLVSTFPCAPVPGVEADVCLPVAFSRLSGAPVRPGTGPGTAGSLAPHPGRLRQLISAFRPVFMSGRYRFGPLTLRYYGPRLRWLVEQIQPDLVHALRIPFEGMLASWTPPGMPVAVSIWGNDLTLHAAGSASMGALTRRALVRADALVTDANRDQRLARAWGFDPHKPSLVVPGSGGLDLETLDGLHAKVHRWGSVFDSQFDPRTPLVLNPRGFRTGSVRQDIFFQAAALVLERRPEVQFACAAMAGQREALAWIERLRLSARVTLLPHLPQEDLWELFARAAVTISVSQHDGTPNSLLEGMALGAFPVAGDIESIREWITPGVNGLLVEPDKPQALAEAILLALENSDLRGRAAQINRDLVGERASVENVREKIGRFYSALTGSEPSVTQSAT
jgi:glycosyltransferase involved in cell wall biosynthesis